jgi:hypothetical protein
MANIGKWNTPRALATVMSAELNGLANNAIATSATPFDNTVNLDLLVDIEVFLASLSPVAGAYINLYYLGSADGTNFPAPSAADLRLTSTELLVSVMIGTTAATAQRIYVPSIPIKPVKANIVFDNQSGVALNATGNTIKFLAYDYNLNG